MSTFSLSHRSSLLPSQLVASPQPGIEGIRIHSLTCPQTSQRVQAGPNSLPSLLVQQRKCPCLCRVPAPLTNQRLRILSALQALKCPALTPYPPPAATPFLCYSSWPTIRKCLPELHCLWYFSSFFSQLTPTKHGAQHFAEGHQMTTSGHVLLLLASSTTQVAQLKACFCPHQLCDLG